MGMGILTHDDEADFGARFAGAVGQLQRIASDVLLLDLFDGQSGRLFVNGWNDSFSFRNDPAVNRPFWYRLWSGCEFDCDVHVVVFLDTILLR